MGKGEARQVGFQVKAMNPLDPGGEPASVTIPCDLVKQWYKQNYVDWQNLVAAVKVLQDPLAIFGGVRAYREGGYCYVGRPDEWCIKRDCLAPFPEHLVFAVYVNLNLWLFDIQAERLERDSAFLPRGWQERYRGGLLWQKRT